MKKFTQEKENKIIELHKQGLNNSEIAKILNKKNRNSIRPILLKNGFISDSSKAHRIYTINEDYFSQINTPEKAYFLGWIASDGHISLKNTLCIRLQEEDKSVLEILRKFIENNRPLKLIIPNKKYKNRKNQYDLSIFNKNICDDLRKLGYDNQKTYTADFPYFLSENLFSHFVRGLFEGDGCLSIKNKKSSTNTSGFYPTPFAQFYICGTEKVCIGLKSIFNNFKINSQIRKKIGCYTIHICGNENIYKILEWIYKDCDNMKLDRKYNLYQELKNIESRDKSKDLDCKKIPVKQLDLNGNLIKIWPSATDAIKSFNKTNTGSIVAVCQKRKWFKTYHGFKWEYVN